MDGEVEGSLGGPQSFLGDFLFLGVAGLLVVGLVLAPPHFGYFFQLLLDLFVSLEVIAFFFPQEVLAG